MSFTKFAQEKDAASFREAFLETIQAAVADEIEQQKIAVAQSMFGDDYQLEEDLEEEMTDEELDEILDSMSEEELEALAEEMQQMNEISKGAAIRSAGVAGSNDDPRTTSIINRIHKKFGSKAADDAEAHARAQYFGRDGKSRGTDPLNSVLDRPSQMRKTKAGKINKQDQKALATSIKGRMKMHGGKSPLPEDYEQMNELSNKLMQRAVDKANIMADRAYYKGHEYSGKEYEDQAGRIQAGLNKRKTIQKDLGSMSPAKRRKAEAKRSREPVVTNDD